MDRSAPLPPTETRPSPLAVWLPWLAAPLFCLLPIGGCAMATSLRDGAARVAKSVTSDPPLVAIGMPR